MCNLNNYIQSALYHDIQNADPQRGMFAAKRTNTAKNEVSCFPFIHILLIVSQKRGSSILLHCIPQIACESVNFLIGQLLISVMDACFPLLRAKQICIGSATENLKTYRITTVLIKMNVLSNLSDSEFSIGHCFVKVHDAA